MFGIGLLCFCYAPLLLLLKSPPTKEEKKVCSIGIDNSALDTSSPDSEKHLKTPVIIVSESADDSTTFYDIRL